MTTPHGAPLSRKLRAVLLCLAGRADLRTLAIAESHCDGRRRAPFTESKREQDRARVEQARRELRGEFYEDDPEFFNALPPDERPPMRPPGWREPALRGRPPLEGEQLEAAYRRRDERARRRRVGRVKVGRTAIDRRSIAALERRGLVESRAATPTLTPAGRALVELLDGSNTVGVRR